MYGMSKCDWSASRERLFVYDVLPTSCISVSLLSTRVVKVHGYVLSKIPMSRMSVFVNVCVRENET